VGLLVDARPSGALNLVARVPAPIFAPERCWHTPKAGGRATPPKQPCEPRPIRPCFGTEDGAARRANQAVADFVAELQEGWDQHDAGITNEHFADDIALSAPSVPPCKARTPDVAIAQVRRVPLDPVGSHPLEPTDDATGAFSEMSLYVLVRRDRTWWAAAGQNTLIRPGPPESQAHPDDARDE
jgi:hypothetical protein